MDSYHYQVYKRLHSSQYVKATRPISVIQMPG